MIICVKVKRGCFRNENDLRFFSEFVKVSEILSVFYIRHICIVQFGLFE